MPLKEPSVPNVQILMTGLMLGESPRWHEDRLWFSDWGAQELVAVELTRSTRSNLDLDLTNSCG